MVFVKLVEFKMVDVFGNVEFHISAFDNMTDIIRFMNENRILDNIEIYPTDILSGYVSSICSKISPIVYSSGFFVRE